MVGISCENASPEAERPRERPGRNGGPMKRRHGRSSHSRAIYRLPPCRRAEREERRGAVGGKALVVLGAERGEGAVWAVRCGR